MSVSIIPTLQNRRQTYVDKIANARNQITKCERAHETLSSFKATVMRSREDFHSINSSKANILSGVDSVKRNSITAQKYHAGMQNIFSDIGSRIIGVVYTVLLGSISVKLRSYANSVIDYENDIADYEKRIADIDRQIEAAQQSEELARLALGGGE